VKDEYDPVAQSVIPKKYFSGGVTLVRDAAMASPPSEADVRRAATRGDNFTMVSARTAESGRSVDRAILVDDTTRTGWNSARLKDVISPLQSVVYTTQNLRIQKPNFLETRTTSLIREALTNSGAEFFPPDVEVLQSLVEPVVSEAFITSELLSRLVNAGYLQVLGPEITFLNKDLTRESLAQDRFSSPEVEQILAVTRLAEREQVPLKQYIREPMMPSFIPEEFLRDTPLTQDDRKGILSALLNSPDGTAVVRETSDGRIELVPMTDGQRGGWIYQQVNQSTLRPSELTDWTLQTRSIQSHGENVELVQNFLTGIANTRRETQSLITYRPRTELSSTQARALADGVIRFLNTAIIESNESSADLGSFRAQRDAEGITISVDFQSLPLDTNLPVIRVEPFQMMIAPLFGSLLEDRSFERLLPYIRQQLDIHSVSDTSWRVALRSTTPDRAMVSGDDDRVGGIDFNPAIVAMHVFNDGEGFEVIPPTFEEIRQFMDTNGFVPVIINVQPVVNLPLLLGLAEEEPMSDATTFSWL
jgi:hypothetical protein